MRLTLGRYGAMAGWKEIDMRIPDIKGFYSSIARQDGRIACPVGVHDEMVLYHLRHNSGRSVKEDMDNLYCSLSTFWSRYK